MKLLLKKLLSYFADSLILGGLVSIYFICYHLFSLQQQTQKEAMFMLICAFITIILLTCYIPTKTNGQTIGQKIMKIRVVNKNGQPRTYLQSFLRECVIKFSFSTFFIPIIIVYTIIHIILYHRFDFELPHDMILKDYITVQ